MKPCPAYRKELALCAAGALEETARAALLAHTQACPACRRHLAALSEVGREHAAAATRWAGLEPSAGFHRRLAQRVREATPGWAARLLEWRWRLALPAAAALALLALAGWTWLGGPGGPAPEGPSQQPDARLAAAPAEDWLAYRLAANQSSETLDALLARHAAVPSFGSASLTAGTREIVALTE